MLCRVNRIAVFVFLGLIAIYSPQVALASTILTYTGNNFTTIGDIALIPGQYDTTMKVTVSIELASPLGVNFDDTVTPLHAMFNDGRQTFIDPPDPSCLPFPGPPCGFYHFTTDSFGSIEFWNLLALTHPEGDVVATEIRTSNNGINPLDRGFISIPLHRDAGSDEAAVSTPGTWSVAAPEPSSFTLLLIGLAGLGYHIRKRRMTS